MLQAWQTQKHEPDLHFSHCSKANAGSDNDAAAKKAKRTLKIDFHTHILPENIPKFKEV